MSFIWDFIGDLTGANEQAEAAQAAAGTQANAADAGIAEQRRQFDKVIELMSPFIAAGRRGLEAQQKLIGLGPEGSQTEAIAALENSPEMAALVAAGEDGMLQNATATGGLRGGNTAAAMAKFRPEMLSRMINQQYSRLGGLSSMGQATAAGQAQAGIGSGRAIAELMQQKGAATAGGQLAAGNSDRVAFGDLLKIGGLIGGFF